MSQLTGDKNTDTLCLRKSYYTRTRRGAQLTTLVTRFPHIRTENGFGIKLLHTLNVCFAFFFFLECCQYSIQTGCRLHPASQKSNYYQPPRDSATEFYIWKRKHYFFLGKRNSPNHDRMKYWATPLTPTAMTKVRGKSGRRHWPEQAPNNSITLWRPPTPFDGRNLQTGMRSLLGALSLAHCHPQVALSSLFSNCAAKQNIMKDVHGRDIKKKAPPSRPNWVQWARPPNTTAPGRWCECSTGTQISKAATHDQCYWRHGCSSC